MPNTYVETAIAARVAKEKVITEWIGAHPSVLRLPYPEFMPKVKAVLRKAGMGMIAQQRLRILRHEARDAEGIPNDGINYPPRSPTKTTFKQRKDATYEVARMFKGLIDTKSLMGSVRRKIGTSCGHHETARILKRVRRENDVPVRLNGSQMAEVAQQHVLQFSPKVEVVRPAQEAPPKSGTFTLSADAEAGIDLLVPVLRRDGVITITITITPDGGVAYTAECRTVATANGVIHG